MKTTCETGGACEARGTTCSVTGHGGECGSGCGCPVTGANPGSGCGDPFANAPAVWLQDVATAIRDVKLTILRAKVQKAIGPQLEKAADAAWEAGGAMWQSLLAQSKAAEATEELRETLRRVFSEKGK